LVNNHRIRLVLSAIVFVSFNSFSRTDAASFQGLGFIPGGTFSWAYDVSVDGLTVVGYSESLSSNREAFRWTASGGMQGLGFLPGGGRSIAEGVSADGSVVVGYSWTGIDMQAFRWTEEDGMVGLGDLPGGDFWSQAFAVSADGSVVVGASSSALGYEAFRWTESGGMQGLGDLPGGQFYSEALDVSADGSVVVGWSKIASGGFQAFRWTESNGMVSIGGHIAEGVSDNGEVVVGYTSTQAFRWTVSGGMQILGSLPGGDRSDAKAVSPDGSIVVGSARKDDEWEPIIWDASNGMRSIKDILENEHGIDLTGWNLTWAYGISAGGLTIVGYAEYPNNEGWIVSFDSPVTVPDVVDMSQTDAESAIAFANLSVGNITRQFSDTVPEGHVISQEPTGGSEVFINSAVNLTISLGQPISSIIYVDDDAPDDGNGMNWVNAFVNLQDALSVIDSSGGEVNEIRVAEGVYKPDRDFIHHNGSGNRNATFQLINSVVVKGGYAGFGKPEPNARNVEMYQTILTGHLNDDDGTDFVNNDENSYHVVTGSGTDETAVLDGFVITGGNADGLDSNGSGGGMYNNSGSPTLTNCTLIDNWADSAGGGIYNRFSAPMLTNCTFIGNSASHGGVIYNYYGDPLLTNCTFSNNSAQGNGGGMRNSVYSHPVLINCMFISNSADKGGGIYNSSNPTLFNCTFSENSAETDGGGIYTWDNNPTLTNCILWGDTPDEIYVSSGTPVVTYSDVQGGFIGVGNINANPCFVSPGYWVDANDPNMVVEPNDPNAVWVNGDYHLKSGGWRWDVIPDPPRWGYDYVTSRCIDAGNPGSPLGDELLTIPSDPNHVWGQNLRINMGAYGGTAEASMPPYDWALLSDITNDGIVNFVDFAHLADIYLEQDEQLPADFDRDGDVDYADLSLLTEDWLKQTTWHE
jgi:probable HAF family extracellular repeat protein